MDFIDQIKVGSVRESLKTVSTRSSLHFTLMQG
jgi:hypothetical protein